MQPGIIANSWTKLLKMCQMNNILSTCLINDNNRVVKYGALGSLLKTNVFNTWLSSLINSSEVTIFPLEIVNLQQYSRDSKATETNNETLKSILENYFKPDSCFEQNLPFGFAAYGPCLNHFNKNLTPCQEIDFKLKKFKSWTRLAIVFFSQPKKSMHWFHYWSKQRYLWWRKFSSIPSKFSMSDVKNIQADVQQLSLLLEFPWGHEPLETITHYENKSVESMFQTYCQENGLKFNPDSTPSIVVCETELDLAVLAYLSNSYAERWRDGKLKNILHLHYKLVPYKVCILLDAENSETLKRLKNVASHLSKELQKSGILLFPSPNSKLTCIESLFSSFDEMGIPYIIVLNEMSLQSGIAGLRNRDTTLQEQVHITELTSKLVMYLKS